MISDSTFLSFHIENLRLYSFMGSIYIGFPGGASGKEPAGDVETWVWSLGLEDPLEEGMAPHLGILVWSIPWTKESSGLQSMVLQIVGHDWATKHMCVHTHTHVFLEYIFGIVNLPSALWFYKCKNLRF